MNKPLALIVDDEPDIRELLEITLMRMDIDCHTAATISAAKQQLFQHKYQLCLTDMNLPDGNGLDLVELIQTNYEETPVAVITAHGDADSAVRAMKGGAFDFLSKPVDLTVLRNVVNNSIRQSQDPSDRRSRDQLLGDSPAMQRTRSLIAKVSRSQAPVYISGESGTGKELVAKLIHEKGTRSEGPFIPVNCGAIPSELMESEFFGHKKGSFTGATTDKEGLFAAADGGTLFLDEVADLPLHMQVKLLRAIQEKAVRQVGAEKERKIDVRILSATHKDLHTMVEDGLFRQDLYYRLNVIQITVPPLRDRGEDIVLLAEHVLEKLAEQNEIEKPTFDIGARKAMMHYGFPGNVRELENTLERAVTLCENNRITEFDLQLPKSNHDPVIVDSPQTEQSIALEPSPDKPLDEILVEIEKQAISKALEENKFNKTATAKALGMTFRSLRYKLKKLNLD